MLKTCAGCGLEAEPVRDADGKRKCPGCGAPTRPGAATAADTPGPAARRPARTARREDDSVDAGSVFARSAQIWLTNLVPFLGVTVVVLSPLLLYGIVFALRPIEELTAQDTQSYETVSSLLSGLLNVLVTAAVIGGVFRVLQEQPISLGLILRSGLSRVLPCLWTGILTGICTYAPMLPGIAVMMLWGLWGPGGTGGIVVGGLLTIGGFIFVLYFTSALFVAIPVSVIEKVNGFPAIRRSWTLTKGNRGSIFVILLALGIGGFLVGLVLAWSKSHIVAVLGGLALVLFSASFSSVFSAVVYYRLRRSKEGVGLEDLAKVFD
jgi:hypothetical protein